jgi:hypothetical protein
MAPPRQAANLALEEVTQAAFNGVLRALDARKIPIEKFPGPILVGIIAWPELRQGDLFKQVGGTQSRSRRGG